jgi:hypothetical protein
MQHSDERHYLRLVGMIVLSFISMYLLMYSMAHSFADVYNSLNQVYMAGLMTAPMVVIELWLMSSMYNDSRISARRSSPASVARWIRCERCWRTDRSPARTRESTERPHSMYPAYSRRTVS